MDSETLIKDSKQSSYSLLYSVLALLALFMLLDNKGGDDAV